jgi:LacI family transcriptional regulator
MENGIRPFETCNSVDQLIQTCSRASSNRVTAIFAYCDFDALIAKHTVEKLGLRIPEDISIIGFDNSTISSIEEINLSTFAQSTRTIGKQTIENAIKLIKGKTVDSVLVPPTLIKRDSTALCST